MVFLGGWTTPSGLPPDMNAYILNVKGGYIDGATATTATNQNPHACAHKVNHCPQHHNVNVRSLTWPSSVQPSDSYHCIPNTVRCDGSPRYHDGVAQRCVLYNDPTAVVVGAALVASCDLAPGTELLLHYRLQADKDGNWPAWATGWYSSQ